MQLKEKIQNIIKLKSGAFELVEFPLSDEQRALVSSLSMVASPKRLEEFMAGRYCVAKAAQSLGMKPFELAQDNKNAPIWPDGLRGTITHSANFAMAYLIPSDLGISIGIDLEKIISDKRLELMRRKILNATEWERFIKDEPLEKQKNLCTLIFSAKESIYKAIYPLVKQYFDFLDVELVDINSNKLEFKLNSKKEFLLNLKYHQFDVSYVRVENFVFTICYYSLEI